MIAARQLCQICQARSATTPPLHPQAPASHKWFKKRYTREQMREGVMTCKACHKAIHDLIPSEKQVGRHYNTLEKLLKHPKFGRYVEWKRGRVR